MAHPPWLKNPYKVKLSVQNTLHYNINLIYNITPITIRKNTRSICYISPSRNQIIIYASSKMRDSAAQRCTYKTN